MHNRITLNKNRIVEMQKPNIAANEWSAAMDDKTKRLTIDVTETLHRALKIRAVTDGVTMAEIVRQLLMQQFGQDSG
jgi:predicted DNA binding CopG/RHH family protein